MSRPRTLRSRLWPGQDPSLKQREEDRTYALVFSNFIFLLIVAVCVLCKVQHGVAFHVLYFFAGFQVMVMIVYLLNEFWPHSLSGRLLRIFDGESGTVGPPTDEPDTPTVATVDNRKGLGIPLWFTVPLNAYAVGYLTYETGGPSNSPYAQVLIAMLIIAEQVKIVRPLTHGAGPPQMLLNALKEFAPFLYFAAAFYAGLLVFQWQRPIHAKPAPAGLVVGVTALIFLTSTLSNYLTGALRHRHIPTAS